MGRGARLAFSAAAAATLLLFLGLWHHSGATPALLLRSLLPIAEPSNHYQALGLKRDADPAAIKRAFKAGALLHHPDKRSGSTAAFVALSAAAEVLGDAERRQAYDAELDQKAHAEREAWRLFKGSLQGTVSYHLSTPVRTFCRVMAVLAVVAAMLDAVLPSLAAFSLGLCRRLLAPLVAPAPRAQRAAQRRRTAELDAGLRAARQRQLARMDEQTMLRRRQGAGRAPRR